MDMMGYLSHRAGPQLRVVCVLIVLLFAFEPFRILSLLASRTDFGLRAGANAIENVT